MLFSLFLACYLTLAINAKTYIACKFVDSSSNEDKNLNTDNPNSMISFMNYVTDIEIFANERLGEKGHKGVSGAKGMKGDKGEPGVVDGTETKLLKKEIQGFYCL